VKLHPSHHLKPAFKPDRDSKSFEYPLAVVACFFFFLRKSLLHLPDQLLLIATDLSGVVQPPFSVDTLLGQSPLLKCTSPTSNRAVFRTFLLAPAADKNSNFFSSHPFLLRVFPLPACHVSVLVSHASVLKGWKAPDSALIFFPRASRRTSGTRGLSRIHT